MSQKESKIHYYLEQVKNKNITLSQAAEFMQLSYRQAKRLWKKYKELGLNGLTSKKRAQPSNRKIPEERRCEIAKILANQYPDFKPGFATEMLEERNGIVLSSETVRQIMIEHQIWFPRTNKAIVHQRRNRRLCVGELVQTDASDHRWFEDRGPRCHLYIIIDDANSEIVAGHFELEETTVGYFKLFEMYFKKKGLPLSIYSDKRGVFKVNQAEKSSLTQFGRAMKELGIEMIYAHSAPAKGRVERSFETHQDRLVLEMRLENISSIEEGNAYLPKYFAKHNLNYSVTPASPHNAHLPLKDNRPLKYILCFKHKRIVSKNLEVSFGNKLYQIQTDKTTPNLKKKEIDIIETLGGEMRFEHREKEIKFQEYKDIPFQNLQPKDTKKIKQKVFQQHQKHHDKTFSKVVQIRGYCEREELQTQEETKVIQLRLEERRKKGREENQEILNNGIKNEEVL